MIGDSIITAATIDKDSVTFELKDVLTSELSGLGSGGLVSISLLLSSAFSGLVTVYTPYVEYNLP